MKKIVLFLSLILSVTLGVAQNTPLGCSIPNAVSNGSLFAGAPCTVDKPSWVNKQQTTEGISFTIPNYPSATAGRVLDILNDSISGSVAFTLIPGGILEPNERISLRWQGTRWTVEGKWKNLPAFTALGDITIPSGVYIKSQVATNNYLYLNGSAMGLNGGNSNIELVTPQILEIDAGGGVTMNIDDGSYVLLNDGVDYSIWESNQVTVSDAAHDNVSQLITGNSPGVLVQKSSNGRTQNLFFPVENIGSNVIDSLPTTSGVLQNQNNIATLTNKTWNGVTIDPAYGGTGITSLGTGVQAWLGTPSSANLRDAITDETGTGTAVFSNSPTFINDATSPLWKVPSSGTGFYLYNTVDETTNYERLAIFKNSNIFRIASEAIGSGTPRSLFVTGPGGNLVLRNAAIVGAANFSSTLTTGTTSIVGYTGSFTNSSGTTNSLAIIPTVSQTGTAAYRGLWMSVFENTTGSGDKLLFDIGKNTAADGAGTHTSYLKLTGTGDLYFPSVAGGIQHYNTTDEITNYERVRQFWSGNIYSISVQNGGTGVARSLRIIGGSTRTLQIGDGGTLGFFNFSGGTGAAGNTIMTMNGVFSASSGINSGYCYLQTINQSGTAGYKAIWVSPFHQATGSGTKFLLDLGTNSAADGGGTHTSLFSVSSTGIVTMGSSATVAGTFSVGTSVGSSIMYATFASDNGTTNGNTTQSELLFGGASTVYGRIFERGNVNFTPAANASYGSHIIGTQAVTIAASGTHSVFSNFEINPISITAGAGVLTTSATLYVNGAATGATNNYSLFVSGGESRFQGTVSLSSGTNLVFGTGTGSRIGSTTGEKIGFWGATPIVQPSSTGQLVGFTAGGGTTATDESTYTGGVGSTAYTVGDIVRHLKNIGLIAQ